MIASLGLILLCQLAGEAIIRFLAVPVPGPVLGMLFLLVLLLLRDRAAPLAVGPLRNNGVETVSRNMLAHMSLLFVPAGVGVVQKLDLIADRGVAIFLILVASVVITLLVTVGTFMLVTRLINGRGRGAS